jgi:hypothetical protein
MRLSLYRLCHPGGTYFFSQANTSRAKQRFQEPLSDSSCAWECRSAKLCFAHLSPRSRRAALLEAELRETAFQAELENEGNDAVSSLTAACIRQSIREMLA